MQRKGTVGSKGSALLRRDDGDAMQEHAGSFGPTTVAAKFVVTDGKKRETFQVSGITGKRPHTRTNRIALAVAGALSEASDEKWTVASVSAILNKKPVSGSVSVRGMTATDVAAFLLA